MRLYPDAGLGMVVMANTTASYDVDLRLMPWPGCRGIDHLLMFGL